MANPTGHFTAGGQLVEAYWHMFLSSLRPILLAGLFCGGAMWLWLAFQVEDDIFYPLGLWLVAKVWTVIELDPDKLFHVRSEWGETLAIRAKNIGFYDGVIDAIEVARNMLVMTVGTFVGGAILFGAIYVPVAQYVGRQTKKRSRERGAFLTDPASLEAEITADNIDRLNIEWKQQGVGKLVRKLATLMPHRVERDRLEANEYMPFRIAGIPWVWRQETTHFFAMGTTGSGKSTALKDLLSQIRARRQRAVIFDLTGSFVESFYDPERDIILNALDERCPHWSIFNECKTKLQLRGAAQALIPHDGGTGEPFWTEAARMMFVEACDRLIAEGRATNEALFDEIMTSMLPNLHELVQGTVAGPVTEPEARRMAESVRAVLNAHAHAIELLPTDGRAFSIRDWVQNDDGKGGILFISATTTHLAALRSILTLWYDTAIYSLMEMDTAPRDIRMWFLFDELAALHRIPSLENGMRTARNFGGAFVLGIHTVQQLWAIYGKEMGDTIASLGRTKLFLAQPDTTSAEWCSDMIGKNEWRELEKSTTVGVERIRDGIGYATRTEYRALVLPDEIMNLPTLTGYIKMPDGYPAARISMEYVHYPKKHPGFIEREIPRRQRRKPASPRKKAAAGEDGRGDKPASGNSGKPELNHGVPLHLVQPDAQPSPPEARDMTHMVDPETGEFLTPTPQDHAREQNAGEDRRIAEPSAESAPEQAVQTPAGEQRPDANPSDRETRDQTIRRTQDIIVHDRPNDPDIGMELE